MLKKAMFKNNSQNNSVFKYKCFQKNQHVSREAYSARRHPSCATLSLTNDGPYSGL